MVVMFKKSVTGLVLLALSLMAVDVHADLASAGAAYQKHDFDSAFTQFKELAELGQPQAQYSLAVMYARGEGVGSSLTYAHAWAALAGTNGFEKGRELASQLEPQLTPTSLKISSDIEAQYSQTNLNTRLLPRMLQGREYSDREPVRPFKPFVPQYPSTARSRGIQGEAYVEFTVAPDGHPRLPRILYAVPAGFFESAVKYSVLHSVYLPARSGGTPIATSVSTFYNFVLSGVTISDYGDLEHRVANTKAKAEGGDPSAQMLYAMMLAGLPQLHQSYNQALPWFLKAAQAGAPYAQYQVGMGLLSGRGCECEATKGEIWLEKAAQADQPDAQVSLAEYLLKDRSNHEAMNGAVVWLERASSRGSGSAKLLLAALLAADPAPERQNPIRALKLCDELDSDYSHDPSFWEVRAAANATRGDYRAAQRAEGEAISRAKELSWDLSKLNERQSIYAANHPWVGNLLDF
jgi:uncharacterized protein